MTRHEAINRQIGDDITIVNQDRVTLDPIGDIFNSTASF
jgi:hypothetical protein